MHSPSAKISRPALIYILSRNSSIDTYRNRHRRLLPILIDGFLDIIQTMKTGVIQCSSLAFVDEIVLVDVKVRFAATIRFSVSTSRNQCSASLGSDEHVLTSIPHEKTLYLKVRLFFSRGLCLSTLKDGVGYSLTVKALLLSFSEPALFPLGSSLLSNFACSESGLDGLPCATPEPSHIRRPLPGRQGSF